MYRKQLTNKELFPWICAVFFTAVKNCFTSDENTLSKKKDISCPTTSQANCSVNRMICSRFLSDYLEIFSAAPRKSLDNHSKTSHRSSCFPHSFFEVVEHENYYFLLQVHFPPLEYAKFTARKTRHEVDKSMMTSSCDCQCAWKNFVSINAPHHLILKWNITTKRYLISCIIYYIDYYSVAKRLRLLEIF